MSTNNKLRINEVNSRPTKKKFFSRKKKGVDIRREIVLEEDRVKRRNILLSFTLLLSIAVVAILFLAFKPSVLQDNYLINNIELLSNNEELDFYDEMEFYQWLDLSTAEQSVDSL